MAIFVIHKVEFQEMVSSKMVIFEDFISVFVPNRVGLRVIVFKYLSIKPKRSNREGGAAICSTVQVQRDTASAVFMRGGEVGGARRSTRPSADVLF